MKIAVVLIVKDEAADILPWLGWYVQLGVDTLIVYDDGSTDGTTEMLSDAAKIYDIRLIHVPPSAQSYTFRQTDSYCDALHRFKDEFEWIGFFDADEYLAVDHGRTLKELLQGISDTGGGAMAVHWRNYGSSRHVLTPQEFPFSAYTWHSSLEEPINRHIKSFVRPALWTGSWVNVHYFDVAPALYLYPNGQMPVWSNVLGITQALPTWDGARIMHYQCRSLEQYVNRIRKRPDIPADPRSWYDLDCNDYEDISPRSEIEKVGRWVATVNNYTVRRILTDHLFANETLGTGFSVAHPLSFRAQTQKESKAIEPLAPGLVQACLLRSAFGTYLRYDAGGDVFRALAVDPSDPDLVVGLRLAAAPDTIFIISSRLDRHVHIAGDPRLGAIRAFEVMPVDGGEFSALFISLTQGFLSAEPSDIGGLVTGSKRLVDSWEKFYLAALDSSSTFDKPLQDIVDFCSEIQSLPNQQTLLSYLYGHWDAELVTLTLPIWSILLDKSTHSSLVAALGASRRYTF